MMEWQAWKDRIWELAVTRYGYPGLVPLEQFMYRSRRERRCIECGAAGTVQQTSVLIKSVTHYWMCDGCDTYWCTHG